MENLELKNTVLEIEKKNSLYRFYRTEVTEEKNQ